MNEYQLFRNSIGSLDDISMRRSTTSSEAKLLMNLNAIRNVTERPVIVGQRDLKKSPEPLDDDAPD